MTSENMTRRGFVGAMGAMGIMGAGALGTFPVVRANAAESAAHDGEKSAAHDSGELNQPVAMAADGTVPALSPTDSTMPMADGDCSDLLRRVTDLTDDELDAMLLDEAEVTEDYVTPSGKVIPASIVRLRNRVNRISYGMGSNIEGETEWDYLMRLFSEADAEHFCEMPMFKWFDAYDYAVVSGRDYDEARDICEDMASRSLIIRYVRSGVPYYCLLTSEYGFWEMNLDNFSKEFMEDHNVRAGDDWASSLVNSIWPMDTVVPADPSVVRGDMVPYSNWQEVIDRNTSLSVSPCQCRARADLLEISTDSCRENHPRETCITTGEMAEFYIERGIGRRIDQDEAKQIISHSVDQGMVVEMNTTKKAEVICQCHSDCCVLLGSYHAMGGEGNMMEHVSGYNLEYDKDTCIKCGACIDRCPMEAITFGDDGYCVMDKKCVRCGQCAIVCPVDARGLVAKDASDRPEMPDDLVDGYLAVSRARMAQGYIHDFTGAEA